MKKLFKPAAMLLTLFLVAGCETPLLDSGPSSEPKPSTSSYFQMAPMAPPTPMAEEVPTPTYPALVTWRRGHWSYSGGEYRWVPGEFIDKPSPTAIWAHDRWSAHKYGWAFVPGHWQ